MSRKQHEGPRHWVILVLFVDFTAVGFSEELDFFSLMLPFVGFTPMTPFFLIIGCFFDDFFDASAAASDTSTGGVAVADGGS